MAPIRGAILLWLIVVVAAGPVPTPESRRTQCASFCPANSKFGYEAGKSYDYTYTSTVRTHLPPSASSSPSSNTLIRVASTVHIDVLARCEMILRLSGVSVQEADPQHPANLEPIPDAAIIQAALQKSSLRFSWVDGRVEGICPAQQEEPWVLNVKRGILSSLQNVMNDFNTDLRTTETDVTGECPVEYQVMGTGWDGSHSIKKTKDTENCRDRQQVRSILQGVPYSTANSEHSTRLMKGRQSCMQSIDSRGVLVTSTCHETHVLSAVTRGEHGATTEVETNLQFDSAIDTAAAITGNVAEALPLLYDHSNLMADSKRALQLAVNLLAQFCQEDSPAPIVSSTGSSLFGQLVHNLRELGNADLFGLHVSVKRGDICLKAGRYLYDAIPMLGTVASARLIKEMVLAGEVSGGQLTTWMTSLTFLQHPTPAMIAEVTPLLQNARVSSEALLPISSMVNNLCRHHPGEDCGRVQEVRAVINILHSMLGQGCTGQSSGTLKAKKGTESRSSYSTSTVILALRALANAGHAQSVLDTLNQCILNEKLDMEVRITAVQVFRRMDCVTDMSQLLKVFGDTHEESELRINAYLSLMSACPSQVLLQKVYDKLQVEEVNQVGSFIWTHLTNLQEASSPLKQHLRRLLADKHLTDKFDLDKRKFSRNIEKGFYLNNLDVGASVESNIIFSAESFVPRSASVNLTVDLFGQSVNLLDMGVRTEGFSDVLKRLLDKHTPPKDSDSTHSAPEMEDIDRKFSKAASKHPPHGSFYLRFLGNEISYADFDDSNLDVTLLKDKLSFFNWLSKLASDGHIEFTKSVQFLDSSVNVPTISGLPLHIRVEGNAITDVKVKGKADFKSLFTPDKSLVVETDITPSATLEIQTEMGVNVGQSAKSGIKTHTTLHTSTAVDGKVEIRNGEVFNIELNLPKDTMDIFRFSNKIHVLYQGDAKPWTPAATGPRIENSYCTGPPFSFISGLDVCTRVSLPSPQTAVDGWSILTSPAEISIKMHKVDTFSKYQIEARLQRTFNGHNSDHFRVSFNTPGSETDRELTVDYMMNPRDRAMKLELKSPWKKALLTVSTDRTSSHMSLHAAATIDNRDEYKLEADIETGLSFTEPLLLCKPSLTISSPNTKPKSVKGSLEYTGDKFRVDFEMRDVLRLPVTMHFHVNLISEPVTDQEDVEIRNGKRLKVSLSTALKSEWANGGTEGFIERVVGGDKDVQVHSSRISIFYALHDEVMNRVTISNKLRDASTKELLNYTLTSGLTNTIDPSYNYDLTAMMSLSNRYMAIRLDGSLNNDDQKSIYLRQNASFVLNPKSAEIDIHVKLPYKNIDHMAAIEYKHFPKEFVTSVIFKSEKETICELSCDLQLTPSTRKVVAKVLYPGRHFEVAETFFKAVDGHHKHTLAVQHQKNQVFSAISSLVTRPYFDFESTIQSPLSQKPIKLKGKLDHRPWFLVTELRVSEIKGHSFRSSLAFEVTRSRIYFSPNLSVKSPNDKFSWDSSFTIQRWYQYQFNIVRKTDPGGEWSIGADTRLSMRDPHFKFKFINERFSRSVNIDTHAELAPGDFGALDDCNFGAYLTIKSYSHLVQASAEGIHGPRHLNITMRYADDEDVELDGNLLVKKNADWKEFDGKVTAKEILRGKPKFDLSLALKYNENVLDGSGKVQMSNGKVYELDIFGEKLRNSLEGNLKINAPNEGLDEARVTYKRTWEGFKTNTTFMCYSIDKNKKITLKMDQEEEHSSIYKNMGIIKLTNTRYPAEPVNITWFRQEEDHIIVTNATLQDYHRTHSLTHTSKMRPDKKETNVVLGIQFYHTRYPLIYTITSVEGPTEAHGHVRLDVSPGKGSDILDYVVKHDGYEFDIDIQLHSPSKIKIIVSNKKEDGCWNTNVKVQNDNRRLSSLGSKLSSDLNSIDLKFKYNDLSRHGLNMRFDLHKEYSNKWTSLVDIKSKHKQSPFPNVTFSGDLDLSLGRRVQGNFELEALSVGHLKSDLYLSALPEDLHVEVTVEEADTLYRSSFRGRLNFQDFNDMKVKINWEAPFLDVYNGSVVMSHKSTDSVSTYISLQVPKHMLSIKNEFQIEHWKSFYTKTTGWYGKEKRLSLTTRFDLSQSTSAMVELETPFKGFEYKSAKFHYSGPMHDCKGNIEIGLDKDQIITVTVQRYHERDIHFIFKVSTPFTGFKTGAIDFNFAGYMDDYQQDWAFALEDKRLAGQNIFKWKADQIDYTSALQTPFEGYENKSVKVHYEGPSHDCKAEMEIALDRSQTITVSMQRYHERDIHFIFKVITPFTNFTTGGIDFNFVGFIDDYQQDWAFTLEENRLAGQNIFKWKGNHVDYTSAMQTPFEGYGNLLFKFKHDGPLNNFSHIASFVSSAGISSIENGLTIQGGSLSLRSKIQASPFLGPLLRIPKVIAFAFNHNGHFWEFQNDAQLTLDEKTYGTENTFKIDGSDINIGAKVNHDGTISSFSAKQFSLTKAAKGKVQLNAFGYQGSLSHELSHGDGFKGKLKAETGLKGFERLSAEAEHKGTQFNFENSFNMQVTDQEYTVGSKLLFDPTNNRFDAKLLTSFPNNYSISISRKGPLMNFKVSAEVKTGDAVLISTKGKFIFKGLETDVVLSVTTPFEHYDNIEFKFKHREKSPHLEMEASLQVGIGKYDGGLVVDWADNISLAIDFRTPVRSLNLHSQHIGTLGNFKGTTHMALNDKMYTCKSEFIVERGDMNMKLRLYTPEEYSIAIQMTREVSEYKTVVVIGMDGRNIHFTNLLKTRPDDMRFEVAILTPYLHLERQSLKFTYKGHINQFKTSGHIETSMPGYDSIGFNANHYGHGSHFETSADIHTPFILLQTASLNINHQSGRSYLKNDFKIYYNRQFTSGALDFEKTGDDIRVSAMGDSSFQGYEKFLFKVNRIGSRGNFKSHLTINTPFKQLSMLDIKFDREGYLRDFRTGFSMNCNGNVLKLGANIDVARPTENLVSAFIELPIRGLEKFSVAHSYRRESTSHILILHAETPFNKFKSIDFKLKLLPIADKFEMSITAFLIKPMEFNLKNRIIRNGVTTSGSLLLPEIRINLVNAVSRTLMRIHASGSIETSLENFKRFAYTCGLDGSEEDMLHFTANLEHPFTDYASPGAQLSIKLSEDWHRDLEVTAIVRTPYKTDIPININIVHSYDTDHVSSSIYVAHRKRKVNLAFQYARFIGSEELSGIIEIPVDKYSRFAYRYFTSYTGKTRTFSGKIETPFKEYNNPSFDMEYQSKQDKVIGSISVVTPMKWISPLTGSVSYEQKYEEIMLTSNAQANGQFIRMTSNFGFGNRMEAKVNIDTSFTGYEKFGIDFTGQFRRHNILTNAKVLLPAVFHLPTPHLEFEYHHGSESFKTKLFLQVPVTHVRPVTLSTKYQGHWLNFNAAASASYGTMGYSGQMKLLSSEGALEYRASLTLPADDSFSVDIQHIGNFESFSSSVKVHTPYEGYADPEVELIHETFKNSFNSKIKIITPMKHLEPVFLNVDHQGEISDFRTNIRAQYSGQTISLNGAFEKKHKNVKLSLELQTPFYNYEHFGIVISHTINGEKSHTAGNIVIPFRQFASPSFDLEYRGNLRDFSSSLTIISPFQNIDPIEINVNHKGDLRNFQIVSNVIYQGRIMGLRSTFKLGSDGIFISSKLDIPIYSGGKVSASFKILHDKDHIILAKAAIHTPYIGYDMIAAEFKLGGELVDFHVNAKLESPCPLAKVISVTLNHVGTLTDFNSKAAVELDHFKQEVEIQNRWLTNHEVLMVKWGKHRSEMIHFELEDNLRTPTYRVKKAILVVFGKRADFEEEIHSGSSASRYISKTTVHAAKVLTITTDVTDAPDRVRAAVHINHPSLEQRYTILMEMERQAIPFSHAGNVRVSGTQGHCQLKWKVADESTMNVVKYTGEVALKLPQKSIDTQLNYIMEEAENVVKLDGKLEHAAEGQLKKFNAEATLDKPKRECSFQLKFPQHTMTFAGRYPSKVSAQQELLATVASNVHGSMGLDLKLDTTSRSFSVAAGYDLNLRPVIPDGTYNHATAMNSGVTGKTVHVLGSHSPRQPIMFKVYHQGAGGTVMDIHINISREGDHLVKARVFARPDLNTNELSYFLSGTRSVFFTVLSGFKSFATTVESIIADISAVLLHPFEAFIRDNDFHARDAVEELFVIAMRIGQFLQNSILRLEPVISQTWNGVVNWTSYSCRKVTTVLPNFFYILIDRAPQYIKLVEGTAQDILNYVMKSPTLGRLNSFVNSAVQSVALEGCIALTRTKEWIGKVYNKMQPWASWVSVIVNKIEPHLLNATRLLSQTICDVSKNGLSSVTSALNVYIQETLHLEETKLMVWAPTRGLVEVQVYIPFPLEDVRALPSYIEHVHDISQHFMDVGYAMKRLFYTYKPRIGTAVYLPPYQAHALVAGGQHFMTFDKRFYDFSGGNCSYLLVKDFTNDTFAVSINYHKLNNVYAKKSLTLYHETNQVELLNDFRVKVDGQSRTLPVVVNNMAIYQQGNELKVDISHGVEITCQRPYDICIVSVTGWYHGKLAGMLGTFNNEQADDMLSVNGSHATSIQEFTNSWRLNRKCNKMHPRPSSGTANTSPNKKALKEKNALCVRHFKRPRSKMAACFDRVSSGSFYETCRHGDVCQSAAFYITECQLNGVLVSLPQHCSIRAGSSRKTNGTPK